ncbi:hypothetical protein [Xiamenia xianingshaonis]|uniref:hypothetical protein n=1 Tax=Xiamenia xianingshaonis TaxID=2682776 RepID=UPI00140B549F|nr:hypothetical protein [Xiamenia xianingshaonis]
MVVQADLGAAGAATYEVDTYEKLEKALDSAESGDIIKLTKSIDTPGGSEDFGVVFRTNGVTLDLGNNTIAGQGNFAIYIYTNVQDVVIKNGFLNGGSYCTVYMPTGAMSLTLDDVHVTSAEGHGGIWDYGAGSTLKLTNCEVLGDDYAIYHNGSTAPFTLNATNSTITKIGTGQPEACAIYVSAASTNTENGRNKINLTGCTVTGPTGIEGKYTDMTLKNCDVTSNAAELSLEPSFIQSNSGATSVGFAVVATDNSTTPKDFKVNIPPKPEATITIDGGTYTGLVGLSQFEGITEYKGFVEATYRIAGGAFSMNPHEYNYAEYEYEKKGADGLYRCAHSGTPKTTLGYYPATCGDDGYAGTTYCKFCKEVASFGATIPATGQHAYGEWTVTKEATEFEPGEQERACSVCSEKETEEVPALGHTPSEGWQSDESDHWKVCEGCGAELERALHDFGEWAVTKEATEQEPGEKARSCGVCGATEAEELPALGHKPSAAWSSNADAHWKVCEGCGVELEKAPHAYGEWKTTKEATTQAAGLRERSCSVCGYVQSEEIPKLSPVPEGGSGWVESDDGSWGYVDAGEPVEQGWKEVDGSWYYFEEEAMQTGWKEVDGDWYYLEDTGKMATGWAEVGGEWYHLGKSGKMDTGWKQDGGTWYYLNGAGEGVEGAMATGWKKVDGEWYYLAGSGAMRSGWQRLSGIWYLLNARHDGTFGRMLEGWQRVDAKTGAPTSANSWYYLEPGSGAMAANRWVGGYYVDASGLWVR